MSMLPPTLHGAWRLTTTALLVGLAGISAPSLCAAESTGDYRSYAERVVEHVLDNGLRLLVLERHQAPVVSVHTYVDVGSVDEKVGATGVAHMMEHMAFKGTDLIGTKDHAAEAPLLVRVDEAYAALRAERARGAQADPARLAELESAFAAAQAAAGEYVVDDEWSRAIAAIGGVGLNATTSWDATNYFVSLPSQYLEGWMVLESERFQFPVFREFYKERDVVKEERRMRTDDRATGKLIELFIGTAFLAHPYGQPTIGYMSDLDNLSRPVGEAFFKTYYHPGNLIVAVVGDVDAQAVIAMTERYFGDIPAGPERGRVHTVEPPQLGERRVEVTSEEQPVLVIGYHKPDVRHPDAAVYDALLGVLADGNTSRLYRRLVDQDKIALFAGAFGGLPGEKYPNLLTCFAVPMKDPESGEVLLDACEEAIYDEIAKMQIDLVSDAELERVKTKARAEFIRSLASNSGLAASMVSSQALRGTWRDSFTQADRIAAVTAEDIRRVARETLRSSNRTVGRVVPPAKEPWELSPEERAPKTGRAKPRPPAAEAPVAESPVAAPTKPVAAPAQPVVPTTVPAAPTAVNEIDSDGRDRKNSYDTGLDKPRLTHPEPGFGVERPSDEMVARVSALVDRLLIPEERNAARAEIIALGKDAVPVLMMRKDDPAFTIRWEVVNCGGYIADPRQIPSIVENVMNDENPHIRWRGMWALSEFSDPGQAIELFEAGMQSEDPFVRWNAAIGLSMSGSDHGLGVIHEGLRHADSWKRWEAINALSRIGTPESAGFLEPIITDGQSSDRDRQEAVLALGRIGGERATDLLLRALADPSAGVRWRACMSLKRVRDPRVAEALRALEATETDADVLKHLRDALKNR